MDAPFRTIAAIGDLAGIEEAIMTLFGIQQPPSIDPADIVKLPAIRARYGLISVPGVVHGPAVDRVRVAPRVPGNGDVHAFAYRLGSPCRF